MNMQSDATTSVAVESGHFVFIPNEHLVTLGKVDRTFRGGAGLSQKVLQHLVEHGLKQKLGDAFSSGGKGAKDSDKMADAIKVWDNLCAGKIRVRRAESDPVEKYARQFGLKHLKNEDGFADLSNEDKKARLEEFLDSADDKAAVIWEKAEQAAEIERSLADL